MTTTPLVRSVAPVPVRTASWLSRRRLVATRLGSDLVTLAGAVLAGWSLRLRLDDLFPNEVVASQQLGWIFGPWILLGWVLALWSQGAYDSRNLQHGAAEIRAVVRGSFLALAAVGIGCYLLHIQLSRGFVAFAFLSGTAGLLAGRRLWRWSLERSRLMGRNRRRVLAVGGAGAIRTMEAAFSSRPRDGLSVVARCTPDPEWSGPDAAVRIIEAAVRSGADAVVLGSSGLQSAEELRALLWQVEGTDLDIYVLPDLHEVAEPRLRLLPVAGLPLLHVEQPQAGRAGGMSKRVFDVVTTLTILLLTGPLLLVVAAAIKLQDGGPVLFRQPRVGLDGRVFGMVKFRSMAVDAEARREELEHANESDGPLFKLRDDPRVTPLGRFLRTYSVDELPQLLNVLRGQMSLVGPRPPLPDEVDRYEVDVHRRLAVRPGMTGLWQVSGRSELSWAEAVRLDLYYVDNWSMTTDLVIIAKTVRAVLRSSGAY